MSSPYVKLGSKTLDQWKVTELKEELKKRKLATKGLKEDLIKRLDEAVRSEMVDSDEEDNDSPESILPPEQANTESNVSERANNSVDKEIDIIEKVDAKPENEVAATGEDKAVEDNDSPESNLPPEQANTESNVSERANNSVDKEIDIIEKVNAKPENEVAATGEDKAVEADLVLENKADGREAEQVVQISAVETTVMVSETVEPVTVLSGSHSESLVTNDDGVSTTLLSSDGYPEEDAKHKSSEPNTQSTLANECSIPVTPPGNTQEEATHTTDPRENDDFKSSQPDSIAQPLKYQVSEVNSDSGFQVTSDSVSTASVSIIEKNELKVDVIADNVQLELDVKHEMVQPSPSSAAPDVGESHPMDVEQPINKNDLEEPLDTKDFQDPVQKKEYTEAGDGNDPVNGDSFNGDMDHPEKLNLDRSSGDDSMEEDILESKQMEDKSDTSTDNVGKSKIPIVKEDDHVDVVGHDKPAETKVKPVEIKITDADNEIVSAPTPGKRKFQDKEAVVNNDTAKKVRRWNAEGLKTSEPQNVSLTPKGGLPELSFKPVSGTNSTVNAEVPKERQVPAPSRPPSNSLRIDRFLRPFTLKAVQELLGKTGTVTSFWMDHIKTHCYVSYSSVEEAVETRNAVYNLQWPPNGGRCLVAEFVDPQEVKSRVEAPPASPATPSTSVGPNMSTTQHQPAVPPQPSPRQQVQRQPLPPPTLPPPPLSNPPPIRDRLHPPREQPLPARDRLNLPPPPPLPEKVDLPIVTLDDLFRKTKATPRIYYLPLSDEQVAKKLETQGKNVNQ